MSAPGSTLDLSALPGGPLRLAIANLRASANYAACTGCKLPMRDCRHGEQPCCDDCAHPLPAADVSHAADQLTEALNRLLALEVRR